MLRKKIKSNFYEIQFLLSRRLRKSPDFSRLDQNKKTILLVIHEASRTGAPILGYNIARGLSEKYNVVIFLFRGGELEADLRENCAILIGPFYRKYLKYPKIISRIIRTITSKCEISYAIINSVGSSVVIDFLNKANIPTITLVHEFSSSYKPTGHLGRSVEGSTRIIFPAQIVLDSACTDYPALAGRPLAVFPQGRCELPKKKPNTGEREKLDAAMRPRGESAVINILGCGTVEYRKGIDIFINCASIAAKRSPRPVRFTWIGASISNRNKSLVSDLIKNYGASNFQLLDPVSDLDPAYKMADIFFLSSRQDPLPNVCIDAAFSEIPVICFAGATGFVEYLKTAPVLQTCILQDFDEAAAAQKIVELACDDGERQKLGRAIHKMAETTFDMKSYIRTIDRLGKEGIKDKNLLGPPAA